MTTRRTGRLPLLLCLLLSALTWGCATGTSTAPEMLPFSPQDAWHRFQAVAHMGEAAAGPFRVSANLSYVTKQGSQRVSVYFWGNGSHATPYPLRLDILAGPGNIVGKVREDEDDFLAYAPGEKTAYTHSGGRLNLLAFGVPLPFSLADLSLLLTGQYNLLFINENAAGRTMPVPAATAAPPEALMFRLRSARLPGDLEINSSGLPVSWAEPGGKGWSMEIEYWDESTRTTPRKIRLTHSQGAEATIIVRDLARPDPFAAGQLDLLLPPDTIQKPLKEQ